MAGSIAEASANIPERLNELIDIATVGYINQTFNNIWAALEPLMLLIFATYIVIMGFGVLRGVIAMPVNTFIESILKFGLILTLVSNWDFFSTYVVDVITNTPDAMAGVISGNAGAGESATAQIGLIYNKAIAAVTYIKSQKGWVLPTIMGLVIFIPATLMMVFAIFLIVLSKIAIAVLVGISPIFIVFLLFGVTRQMFEAWLRQVINYALIIVFTVAVLGLTNRITDSIVDPISTGRTELVFGDILPSCVMFLLVFLLLTQVMNIASSLAGGLALSTQNTGSYFGRKAERAIVGAPGSALKATVFSAKAGNSTRKAIKKRKNVGNVSKVFEE